MLLPCIPNRSLSVDFLVLSLVAVLSTEVLGSYYDYDSGNDYTDSIDQFLAERTLRGRQHLNSGNSALQDRQGRMLFPTSNNFLPPADDTSDNNNDAVTNNDAAVNDNSNIYGRSSYSSNNNNVVVRDSDPAATAAGNTHEVKYEKTIVLPTEYFSSGESKKVKTTKKVQNIIQNEYTRIHQHNKIIQNQINDRYLATYYRPLTNRYINKHHQTTFIRNTQPYLNKIFVNLRQDIYKPQVLTKVIQTYDESLQRVTKPVKVVRENKFERLKTIWEPVRNLGTQVINGENLLYAAAREQNYAGLPQNAQAPAAKADYLRNIWSNESDGEKLGSRNSKPQQSSAADEEPVYDDSAEQPTAEGRELESDSTKFGMKML